MTIRVSMVLAALLVFGTGQADAQYFGRNKVLYERFDFKVLATEHFDIYYYPEEEESVQLAARMAERWYMRLSRLLRHELSSRQPLILYAAHPHFQQTNALSGEIGEGTGGVTEMLRRRVILPFAGGLAETDHVLGHELVHAFQFDISATFNQQGDTTRPAVLSLPLWFVEGMAEYLSLGPVDANTAMWVREAVSRDRMPDVDRLDDPDYFPYRYGHAFWAYVGGRWGDRVIGDMFRAAGPQGSVGAAIEDVLSVDTDTFSRDWHEATAHAVGPVIQATQSPSAFGRPLIMAGQSGGNLNISPALSPDGQRLVFLSEKSLFSIDMYLADASSGRVIRKLVETSGDPHFDSLEFLNSAGDWAPDNRRFAFTGLTGGQPVLAIIDVDRNSREREIVFEELDQIFNPAWSPDGRRVAFSALKGGVLDLYVVNLDDGAIHQLTDDPFADLDPEWMPDGRSLAWVTDRFTANLDTLSFGNYRIGLMDLPDGQTVGTVRLLTGFGDGRNSNPEFSSDGRWLYFIGRPDGVANIYRVDMHGGEPQRLTNVISGVSGITPLTPALSLAAAAPKAVFTVFEANHYNLYLAEPPAPLPEATNTAFRDADVLAPINRNGGDVVRFLAAPATGLPAPTLYPETPYRASLNLEQIGQPMVGVGVDRFGTYAAGGISMVWGDMLGQHQLAMVAQVTSRLDETGAAVVYLNRRHRWNWGFVGEQTPFITGSFAQGITTIDGTPALVEETRRIRQTNRGATGILQYPFSRAQRVELSGGLQNISFDSDVETRVFSLSTGQQLNDSVEDLPRPESLNLGMSGVALVHDSALIGVTSPIFGQRYRFEYTQLAGTLTYSGLLADYRRYFLPARPFTIAVRGMHYGRYGADGQDPRLAPLFLGYPSLVRGYDIDSLDSVECRPVGAIGCPILDSLTGTRLAVLNLELRFPPFGLFNRNSYYGPVPLEVAFFGDAGTAWKTGMPAMRGEDSTWVRSTGVAFRFNAFGYAIIEMDYVRPLDRPGKGWTWQFNFTPGF